MTDRDIMQQALEAWLGDTGVQCGFVFFQPGVEGLDRFAALVAAAEREACAKVCDAVRQKNEDNGAWMWEAKNCAAAIRARGNDAA